MSNSALDDLGFGSSDDGTSTAPPPAASSQGDPAVWTLLGEAGPDPQKMIPVGATIFNRMTATGVDDPAAIVTNPRHAYEAWLDGTARAKTMATYPVGSAAYQAAEQVLADLKKNGVPDQYKGVDSFYSPKAQAALGREKPAWDDGTGVDVGGNLFFRNKFASASDARPGSALDDLGFGSSEGAPATSGADNSGSAAANTNNPGSEPPTEGQKALQAMADAKEALLTGSPVADHSAAAAAVQQLTAASASGKAQWPIYDPINHVGRNQDGSIAFIGAPSTAEVGSDGSPTINVNSTRSPEAIAKWQAAHPLDPANSKTPVPQEARTDLAGIDNPDAFDLASAGVSRGVGNAFDTIQNAVTAARGNPLANAFLQGTGIATDPIAAARARAGAQVLNRNAQDVAYQGQTPYDIGKFGGEVAATVPMMAAGDAAAAAPLAGTRFAPVADFLAGDTAGSLLGARGASLATRGTIQGAEAAGLTSSGSSAPLSQQVAQGAEIGAAGGMVPGALGAVGRRLFTQSADLPNGVRTLADAAINKYNIPLTRDQVLAATGDRTAGNRWSNMFSEPGSGVHPTYAAQQTARDTAIGDTFGGDINGNPVTTFTPDVLSGARKRIGQTMNNFAQTANVTNLTPLNADLARIEGEIKQTPLGDNGASALQAQIDNIRDATSKGNLTGADFQTLTRHNGPLDLAQNSRDPSVRRMADQIEDALQSSVQSVLPPEDVAAFQNARAQYKNLMTVGRAVKTADIEGHLTPSALNTAVEQSFKGRAFRGAGTSAGDLGELANISRFFMKEPPNSGAPLRLMEIARRNGIPLALEGGAGLMWLHDPQMAMKLGLAGLGAGALKYGNNLLYSARNSPDVAASFLGPQSNQFFQNASPEVRAALGAVNDNFAPASALGANQFLQQQR